MKRVSISTNQILLNDDFELRKEMAELIPILSTKYRIFLITQVSADKAADHNKAKTNLDLLVKQKAIRDHRVMFCTT